MRDFDRPLRPLLCISMGQNWLLKWTCATTKGCSMLKSKYTIAFSMLYRDRNYLLCSIKYFLSLDTWEFDRPLRPLLSVSMGQNWLLRWACATTKGCSILKSKYTIAFSMLYRDRNYLCSIKYFLSLDTWEFDRPLRLLQCVSIGQNWLLRWTCATTKGCSILKSKYTIAFSMLYRDRNYLLCSIKYFLSLVTWEFDRPLRSLLCILMGQNW